MGLFKKKETQEPEPKCSVEDVRALLNNSEELSIYRKEEGGCRFAVIDNRTGDEFEVAFHPVKRGPF